MVDDGLNSVVYSKNVIEFVTVASQYCMFVERSGNLETRDFLDKIHKLLPLLYLKATLIPDFDTELEDTPEKFVTELDYNIIQQRILKLTGGYDDYQEVFNSDMSFSESAITESISEDLTDIYQDLKDFVSLYQIGSESAMEEGLWACKNNFSTFWGQKLVNCLRAVHHLVYSDINFEEKQSVNFKAGEEIPNSPHWLNQKFMDQENE